MIALLVSLGSLAIIPIAVFSLLFIVTFIAYSVMSNKYDSLTYAPIEEGYGDDDSWNDLYDDDDDDISSIDSDKKGGEDDDKKKKDKEESVF